MKQQERLRKTLELITEASIEIVREDKDPKEFDNESLKDIIYGNRD